MLSVVINRLDTKLVRKLVRTVSGLSIKDVSEKTGFSISTISNFENFKIECDKLSIFYSNLCYEYGIQRYEDELIDTDSV